MALISRKALPIHPQELGKIKIGGISREIEKEKNGQKYTVRVPMKIDHFVVTTRNRNPAKANNFERDAAIHTLIGDKPTELDAILMYPEVEDNFHSEFVQYAGRGRDGKIWSCDGETARNLKEGKVGTCSRLEGKDCKCKAYSRLHVQLLASPYTLGYHVFRTTSIETTNNLQTALEQIYQTFGTCYHAPVKLVIYPSEDKHEQGTSVSYKVGLVLARSMAEVAGMINEARQYARLAGSEVRQLAAGVRRNLDELDEAEAQEIKEEFFTEITEADVHAHDTRAALHSPERVPDYTREQQYRDSTTGATDDATEPEVSHIADFVPITEEVKEAIESGPQSWSEIAETAETLEESQPDPAGTEARPSIAELEKSLGATDTLSLRYLEALAKRGIDAEEDRRPFEARLAREGKVNSPDVRVWTRQEYRSAIAELHTAPDAGNTGADDDLFNP